MFFTLKLTVPTRRALDTLIKTCEDTLEENSFVINKENIYESMYTEHGINFFELHEHFQFFRKIGWIKTEETLTAENYRNAVDHLIKTKTSLEYTITLIQDYKETKSINTLYSSIQNQSPEILSIYDMVLLPETTSLTLITDFCKSREQARSLANKIKEEIKSLPKNSTLINRNPEIKKVLDYYSKILFAKKQNINQITHPPEEIANSSLWTTNKSRLHEKIKLLNNKFSDYQDRKTQIKKAFTQLANSYEIEELKDRIEFLKKPIEFHEKISRKRTSRKNISRNLEKLINAYNKEIERPHQIRRLLAIYHIATCMRNNAKDLLTLDFTKLSLTLHNFIKENGDVIVIAGMTLTQLLKHIKIAQTLEFGKEKNLTSGLENTISLSSMLIDALEGIGDIKNALSGAMWVCLQKSIFVLFPSDEILPSFIKIMKAERSLFKVFLDHESDYVKIKSQSSQPYSPRYFISYNLNQLETFSRKTNQDFAAQVKLYKEKQKLPSAIPPMITSSCGYWKSLENSLLTQATKLTHGDGDITPSLPIAKTISPYNEITSKLSQAMDEFNRDIESYENDKRPWKKQVLQPLTKQLPTLRNKLNALKQNINTLYSEEFIQTFYQFNGRKFTNKNITSTDQLLDPLKTLIKDNFSEKEILRLNKLAKSDKTIIKTALINRFSLQHIILQLFLVVKAYYMAHENYCEIESILPSTSGKIISDLLIVVCEQLQRIDTSIEPAIAGFYNLHQFVNQVVQHERGKIEAEKQAGESLAQEFLNILVSESPDLDAIEEQIETIYAGFIPNNRTPEAFAQAFMAKDKERFGQWRITRIELKRHASEYATLRQKHLTSITLASELKEIIIKKFKNSEGKQLKLDLLKQEIEKVLNVLGDDKEIVSFFVLEYFDDPTIYDSFKTKQELQNRIFSDVGDQLEQHNHNVIISQNKTTLAALNHDHEPQKPINDESLPLLSKIVKLDPKTAATKPQQPNQVVQNQNESLTPPQDAKKQTNLQLTYETAPFEKRTAHQRSTVRPSYFPNTQLSISGKQQPKIDGQTQFLLMA